MQLAKHWKSGAIAATAILALLLGSAPAQADPAVGTNPILDGFGSDTTQDVMNAVSLSVNRDHPNLMASYDAGTAGMFKPGETSTTVEVPRANGSGQGKTMLLAAIKGTPVTLNGNTSSGPLARDVAEYGRSSSAGKWDPAGVLSYIPFGIDGVSYAVAGNSVIPRNLPLGVKGEDPTLLTLRNIYTGNITTITGTDGKPAALTPLIPQSGSGTRSFWLSALNVAESELGANVKDLDAQGNKVQENDGAHLTRNTDIAPYSIGQYSAQSRATYITASYTGFTAKDRRHGAYLGYINGIAPQNQVRTAANLSFPVLRPVFNMVEWAAVTEGQPNYNAQLAATFAGAQSYVITAKSTSGTSVISDFGFAEIPTAGWTYGGITYLPGMTTLRSN